MCNLAKDQDKTCTSYPDLCKLAASYRKLRWQVSCKLTQVWRVLQLVTFATVHWGVSSQAASYQGGRDLERQTEHGCAAGLVYIFVTPSSTAIPRTVPCAEVIIQVCCTESIFAHTHTTPHRISKYTNACRGVRLYTTAVRNRCTISLSMKNDGSADSAVDN